MSEAPRWRRVTGDIAAAFAPRGFDLVHPFRVSWWDDRAPEEERLPWGGSPDALAVLVGNTRAMWGHFVAHSRGGAVSSPADDPLDRWVEGVFRSSLERLSPRCEIVFAHEPPPRRLPFQRLAARVGFAPLSEGRLLAHPVYGPWFALRAVVLVDVSGPEGDPPSAEAPCAGCAAPCREAFEHALAVADARTDHALLHERWRPWLAVRDACPVGTEHRYSVEQIRYHYAREWPGGSGLTTGR